MELAGLAVTSEPHTRDLAPSGQPCIFRGPVLPDGYTGLVLANNRRSKEWLLGLESAGIDVVRVPATGKDSEKGSWQIGVAKDDEARARSFVSDVIQGKVELPATPALSPMGMRALTGIGVLIVILALFLLIAR